MTLPFESTEDDGDHSVDTGDALDVVARIDFIIASLEKAGVPPGELQHFKSVVGRVSLADVTARQDGPSTDNIASGVAGLVAEGSLEKLQQGVHGFAPVWKPRWIRILPGEMQVFESQGRPERGTPCLFSLPLSVQQTRIDPGNEALCKRLGRKTILMVASTVVVGGPLRCVTLSVGDDFALEKWTKFLEQALSQEGNVAASSIFRASQTGDILRVKELIGRGFPVNRPNAYGCIALHYAAKSAAECATVVARGGDEPGADEAKVRAQEALRVVVFLMSHGGDARAVNHNGETPLEIGSRLTAGFPKSRTLLMSILDSSKYQTTGGTTFIVPCQPQLTSIEDKEDDGTLDPKTATVTTRGVMFLPSRRNCRVSECRKLADSQRPYGSAPISSSSGNRPHKTVPTLPGGDHETRLGGAGHRLAAALGRRRGDSRGNCSRPGTAPTYGGPPASRGGSVERARRGQQTGVLFKDYRMGRSSAVFVGGYKRRRTRPHTVSGTESLATGGDSRRTQRSVHFPARRRPATTGSGVESRAGTHAHEQSTLKGRRGRRRAETAGAGGDRGPSISDREARRQISEWLRESAGTASAAPPAMAHGFGKPLTETSSYVATSHRSDVYKALQAINDDGRGDLISADKLRAILCRVGQPLLPNEMDDLLREADPGNNGYISCSRFSSLVVGSRLAPLKNGATYHEEDDVVLAVKARRLARQKRLERIAAAQAQAQPGR